MPAPQSLMNIRHHTHRRGTILVVAMWMVVILSGLLLVFSRSMRVEAIGSANRLGEEQATSIERGAEQYLLSLIDGTDGDATALDDIYAGNLPLGDGYFWLLRPDPDDEQLYSFGLVDEASKLSLNVASVNELLKLMPEDLADSIVDWRDSDTDISDQGAEDQYYNDLPEPYQTKNSQLETVEELRLVKGFNINYTAGLNGENLEPDVLFGLDTNHNGVIDERERNAGGMASLFNGATSTARGIYPFVTVFSRQYNKDATGKQRTNVNTDPDALTKALGKHIDPKRAAQIVSLARGARPFKNVLDFAVKGGMKSEELGQAFDFLTTVDSTKSQYGLTNIITASRAVLSCLPTLEEADADAMVAARASAAAGDLGWVIEALAPEKCAAIGARITNRSFQYSTEIVACTGDGRSFKRVRVVVDARKSPARIIYRKELTDLGWPLPEQLRNDLRQGIPPNPIPLQATTSTGTGIR